MMSVDVAAYLARLGLTEAGPAGPAALARLHAAHVERVPFETLYHAENVDLDRAYTKIVHQGRGATCFHLNGVFARLLEALGYAVSMHPAGVQSGFNAEPPGPNGSHVMLTVSGLSTVDNPEGRWVLDVGSGEGFHRPLPLRPGTYRQGEFCYRVRPSDTGPARWRIDYDERESCQGVDFADVAASREEYAALYQRQSEGQWSAFLRYGWVKRHHADGYDELLGCFRRSVRADGQTSSEVSTAEEFFTILRETFGLTLADLTAAERDALWEKVRGAWRTKGRVVAS
jgi:N-hydroxyarylamine O-acetyltransferase